MQITREDRLPTGNDVVSIPSLSAADASAPDLNILSMKYKGLVEFHGTDKSPFFKPLIRIGAKALDLGKEKQLKAGRLEHWVPEFSLSDPKAYSLQFKVIAPLSARGFVLDYTLKNHGSKPLKVFLGAEGCFAGLRVRNNEANPLRLWREARQFGGLNSRHLVLSAGGEAPDFALAIGGSEPLDVLEAALGAAPKAAKWADKLLASAWDSKKAIFWQAGKNLEIKPGQSLRFGLNFGFGLEAVSASASCVEMLRQGLAPQVDATLRFFNRKVRFTGDSHLDQLMNLNQWFNYFYAMGVTLDTEDFVCLSSRSPHYYVNGAYWDRDALLWSFPSVLLADPSRARRMLEYAFGLQGRNIGVHSRFLNGAVLEPGFELDQLCAPVIALANYVKNTGDQSLLKDFSVRRVLRTIEKTLQAKKHPSQQLYETSSGPDDDFEAQAYLTYDNVLVWRAQTAFMELKPRMGRDKDVAIHRDLAERVKSAIWKHLTADGPRGRMFVWSADLRGNHRFYSSPAGCLQLLPYFGFCEQGEGVWRNTVNYLHSKEFQYSFAEAPFGDQGCAHAAQPWTLSLCNRMLSGQRDRARALLDKMEFDAGVACESFDSKTGKPSTGLAFASCAGFLAWSIWKAFGRGAEALIQAQSAAPRPAASPGSTVQVQLPVVFAPNPAPAPRPQPTPQPLPLAPPKPAPESAPKAKVVKKAAKKAPKKAPKSKKPKR